MPSSAHSISGLPEHTLRLRDGHDYRLRPLGPADGALVTAMFSTLSAETIQARYGYLIRHLTPDHAHQLAAADPARPALLGIIGPGSAGGETLWAMGLLVVTSDGTAAECAFLVHDTKRRLGMAAHLLGALRLIAAKRGLRRLFAQVRRENRAMLALFRQHHAALHFDPAGEVVDVDIPLRRPKNLIDKLTVPSSPACMASPEKKPFSPVMLVVDLIVTAAFFLFLFSVVKSHVQSDDPRTINFWGAMGAACISGVFWLAWQMVKTVYRFQRATRK